MWGEVNEKQTEYLQDIFASRPHLLSVINDNARPSKIEAGRLELEPAEFDLPGAIDNAYDDELSGHLAFVGLLGRRSVEMDHHELRITGVVVHLRSLTREVDRVKGALLPY